MGVDAILYAKKSNTYYDLDRDRNFRYGMWVEPNPLTNSERLELERVMDKVSAHVSLTCEDVMIAAKLNIRAYSYELGNEDIRTDISILHNSKIYAMACDIKEKIPDEEFIFLTDHGDWDEYYRIKHEIGATEHHVTNW